MAQATTAPTAGNRNSRRREAAGVVDLVSNEHSHRLAFSVGETAVAIGVSSSNVWNLIATGKLPCVRIGRRTLIKIADLEKLLDAS
jgi:excisionase family DNA binding protein